MTNKEFAFNYAGKGFMCYGDEVILVGYTSEFPDVVIVSPVIENPPAGYWTGLGNCDVITYKTDIRAYWYVRIKELKTIAEAKPQTVVEEKPQAVAEVKVRPQTVEKPLYDGNPMTPGECIAYFEGRQGMNYSVVNGCVSAVYKRQGSALKLVSWGDSINNVTEKI